MKTSVLFPFHLVHKGARVILYGAGDVGQVFYNQLAHTSYCELVGWYDKKWSDCTSRETIYIGWDGLKSLSYDYIVIASGNKDIADEIKVDLCNKGIDLTKIIYDEGCLIQYENSVFSVVTKDDITISDKKVEKMLNIGFIATGYMANMMAKTLSERCPEYNLYAVASRDITIAKEFKERYGFIKAYGSYEELVEDDSIDIVYISTPVFLHKKYLILALNHGKHVICEKPFAVNYEEVVEMINCAEEKGLFITDGLWSAYLPLVEDIKKILEEKLIGNVKQLIVDQHYYSMNNPRLNKKENCGGGFLEAAYYLVHCLNMVMKDKEIKDITVKAIMSDEGIDLQENVIIEYEDALAMLSCGMNSVSGRTVQIFGTDGYIIIDDGNAYERMRVYTTRDELIKDVRKPIGYEYQMRNIYSYISNKGETYIRKSDEISRDANIIEEIMKRINRT